MTKMRWLMPIFAIIACVSILFSQSALVPLPYINAQFFGNDGLPLAGGKLYTYAAGTTTPLSTYTLASGGSANSNPITLDVYGRVTAWLLGQSYHLVLKTADLSTIIAESDYVPGQQVSGSTDYVPKFSSSNYVTNSTVYFSGSTMVVPLNILADSVQINGGTTIFVSTTPGSPSSGWTLYVGTDGALRARSSAGATKTLAP